MNESIYSSIRALTALPFSVVKKYAAAAPDAAPIIRVFRNLLMKRPPYFFLSFLPNSFEATLPIAKAEPALPTLAPAALALAAR